MSNFQSETKFFEGWFVVMVVEPPSKWIATLCNLAETNVFPKSQNEQDCIVFDKELAYI
jgi:hypothetical protein